VLSVIFVLKNKITLKNILFFFLGLLLIIFPRIIFELRHHFLMIHALMGYFSKTSVSQSSSNIFSKLTPIFGQLVSTIAIENKLLGVVLIVLALAAVFYFYKKADKMLRNFVTTSFIVILIFILGSIFFSHDIWPHYLVGLPVFYIIIFAISIYFLKFIFKNTILPLLIVVLIFLINLNPVSLYNNLSKPPFIGDPSVYRNQLAVIDYVYSQAKGKNFKYIIYTPPVYDYTYQYLFLWYGPKKYHYSPIVQSNRAYFILEPDFQYPFRLTDWLKQRQGDGKVIKSENFPSGIIVQTRTN